MQLETVNSSLDTHYSQDSGQAKRIELIKFILSALLFAVGMIFKFSNPAEFIIFALSYIFIGGDILIKAFNNIKKGDFFDENFLMAVATVGAFAIGEYPEGVAVMMLYKVGEYFQDMSINKSKKSIVALMDVRPDYANLKMGNEIKKVSPETIKVGDIIVVKAGEKVPLDSVIISGESMVDTSTITGESMPREVDVGEKILSGFINLDGLLELKVLKTFGESTISKILDLVQNANSRKAPTEKFITKFSKIYTPIVVVSAILIAFVPVLFFAGDFMSWLNRALVFLVISCPCALVISIPLGFFGGIGSASRNGILVKGSNYLEALNKIDTIAFDKTGTLTKGVFSVVKISPKDPIDEKALLEYAAFAESYSNHPIALSVRKAYAGDINKNEIFDYKEMSGHGIKAKIKGKMVFVGNAKLMSQENIAYDAVPDFGTVLHVAIDNKYAGYIVISDEIKEDSKATLVNLKKLGVNTVAMLTGDNKKFGEYIGKKLGVDQVYAELLPEEKVQKLEELEKGKKSAGNLVFVGDGANDAPVLARADIGIAMGGLGSDVAIESADIVLMTDEPSKIVTAINIAKVTRTIVWQNIIFSIGVKTVFLVLGLLGISSMWEAVFADVGVSLIAIFNALRISRRKY